MANTIDWKKLRHALGPATRVPAQVKALAGKDSRAGEEAFEVLHDSLIVPGKWFKASAPTAGLLLDALSKAVHKPSILVLLADILGAEHTRAWLAAADDAPPKDVTLTIGERRKSLLNALKAKDPSVRAAAVVPLAMVPSVEEALPALMDLAATDDDDVVRASALLGLARVGLNAPDARTLVKAATGDESPTVRGAGTLALLRMNPDRAFARDARGIELWLSWAIPRRSDGGTEFPWFGGLPTAWYVLNQFLRGPAQGLIELARSRAEVTALTDVVLRLAVKSSAGTLTRSAGDLLLEASGLSRYRERTVRSQYVALPSELTVEQRELAKALAPTWLLPRAGFGLAAAGEARLRWLGISSHGPLDKTVSVEVDKKKVKRPLWKAWTELEAQSIYGDPVPPPLERALSPRERWEAIIEMGAESYGACTMEAYDSTRLEDEVQAVRSDPDIVTSAIRIADDLAKRYAAADGEGDKIHPTLATSILLLLPVLRSGRPLESRWDVLVAASQEPIGREILEAIPDDRREAIVWRDTGDKAPHQVQGIRDTLFVLDLAPSRRIAENVAVRLRHPKVRDYLKSFGLLDAAMDRLQELGRTLPAVREALKSAK